jgi:hypothetical protein
VSKVEGMLEQVNPSYLSEITAMKSFVYMELFHSPGNHVKKTVDCFTWAGLVKLFHLSDDQVNKDYNRIRDMEDTGLFVVAF